LSGGVHRRRRRVLDEQDDLEQFVRESEVLEELERGERGEGEDEDSFTIDDGGGFDSNSAASAVLGRA